MTVITKRWFATYVDRDFHTGLYGESKPRLYYNSDKYVVISSGISYHDGTLTLMDVDNKIHYLKTPPDNKYFEETIYKAWKTFDEISGQYDEDRVDYEPWAYNSLDALAMELGLFEDEDVQMYHNKCHTSS
tara:strand:+ start:321 stop:713 length:393 start_codon:yes stop_codon:yes gene_type:complete